MFGEVSPGGVGSGLYGMLIFVLLSVFIAGLMVGRTPEYLGKKIQAPEMKLVVLYILAVPIAILAFAGASVVIPAAVGSTLNPGAHGLTEIVYAFTSQANNNGSAFGGLTGNTDWYNVTGGSGHVGRPIPAHRAGTGHRGVAGAQTAGARVGGNVPDRNSSVRRPRSWASC